MDKKDLFDNPLLSDIRVGGFYCHKVILVTSCHYFTKIIDVDEVEVEDCKGALQYIYGVINTITVKDFVLLDYWGYNKSYNVLNIVGGGSPYDMIVESGGNNYLISKYALAVCENLSDMKELKYADDILSKVMEYGRPLFINSKDQLEAIIPEKWHKEFEIHPLYEKVGMRKCDFCRVYLAKKGISSHEVVRLRCKHEYHALCFEQSISMGFDGNKCFIDNKIAHIEEYLS